MQDIDIAGFIIRQGALSPSVQEHCVAACRTIVQRAPLIRPVTPWGKPMSVRMTSAGRAGWVIDRGRYAYVRHHPETREPWPEIPEAILKIWQENTDWPEPPDCCLLNWYEPGARMGLHQDKDEGRFDAPVLSISLGAPARFRVGGQARKGPTESLILHSGDLVIMQGEARLAYHGIDKILTGELASPVAGGGRINLTLRVVADDVMI